MPMYSELEAYRRYALKASEDLYYEDSVRDKIHNAKSIGEIERIMIQARKDKWKD